jgi:hypothetical protein
MIDNLKNYLLRLQPGPITDTGQLEQLLADCWDQFTGDDGGMLPHKLFHRMEAVAWHPPLLSFQIDRHGGTVLGSTRAEMQHWEINIDQQTAVIVKHGHRQLKPMAQRIELKPLVEQVLAAIRSGSENELVSKEDDGTIFLNTTRIFPSGSAVRMTLEGRRKRFREAVARELLKEGWQRLGKDSFRPPNG